MAGAAVSDQGRLGREYFHSAYKQDFEALRGKGNTGLSGVFTVVRDYRGNTSEAVIVTAEELAHSLVNRTVGLDSSINGFRHDAGYYCHTIPKPDVLL